MKWTRKNGDFTATIGNVLVKITPTEDVSPTRIKNRMFFKVAFKIQDSWSHIKDRFGRDFTDLNKAKTAAESRFSNAKK